MAHFRSVGGLATLKAGETAYWETTYADLLDEGIVTQAFFHDDSTEHTGAKIHGDLLRIPD
jgi:hypothetical protein